MRKDWTMARIGSTLPKSLLTSIVRLTQLLSFIAVYIALDWASYLHPLHGLNITLWNPAPALGLVLWLRIGSMAAIPWFVALMVGEFVVRGMPATLPATILLSMTLTAGYAAIGEWLRRRFSDAEMFGDRQQLITWLGIVIFGTLANSLIYIGLLSLAGLLPAGDRIDGFIRFWLGDFVGIIVCMPMLWMLFTHQGQTRLRQILCGWETGGYAVLAVAVLWVTFRSGPSAEFQYFYFLFLPVIWAASRQGLSGAATSAFLLQAGVIIAVEWLNLVAVTVMEFQMLGTVLALAGFFIGVVVDEQRLTVEKLKRTLNMAAAGEMAAALAHELNQPMTALAAYGDACEQLLSRGEAGETLRDGIRRMVQESTRAANIVRRVRDFFRTGATQLEAVHLDALLASEASRFHERATSEGVQLNVVSDAITVLADRLQIELVVRNLLANAFDAVSSQPPDKRRIDLTAKSAQGKGITIVVRDNGHGLTASAVRRLFEPFASTKSSGLGLGLVISRALVEAHGGKLWAEPGDCGIFVFTLPTDEKVAGGPNG